MESAITNQAVVLRVAITKAPTEPKKLKHTYKYTLTHTLICILNIVCCIIYFPYLR